MVIRIVLCSLVFASCRGVKTGEAGEAVAHIGDKAITAADFRARLAEQPSFALARYKSLDRKKEFLDGLIRSKLLLEEAHRRNLDADPEVRATIEKVLIQRLSRAYAEEAEKANPASETDLRRYYDQHRSEFSSPTRVRIAHLFLAAPEKDPRRARATTEATRLLTDAKNRTAHGEKQALELLASQRSEDAATKTTGGDLGYRLRDELARAWGAPLADAAFALKTQGEIGSVVASDKGIHLIRLLGRQEGYETSFDVAKSRIESHLAVERKAHAIDQLVADLKKKVEVHIDEAALAKIDVTSPVVAGRAEK